MGTATTAVIASRIEEKRVQLGVSVKELAECTGIPRSTLQRRLGGFGPFDVGQLELIGERLNNTPITEWFRGL